MCAYVPAYVCVGAFPCLCAVRGCARSASNAQIGAYYESIWAAPLLLGAFKTAAVGVRYLLFATCLFCDVRQAVTRTRAPSTGTRACNVDMRANYSRPIKLHIFRR